MRLQGYPEDFVMAVRPTLAYKMLGNSVSVPVVKAVAEKLFEYLK
jgi:DNA (cytosine-5)-methyltransferase 1